MCPRKRMVKIKFVMNINLIQYNKKTKKKNFHNCEEIKITNVILKLQWTMCKENLYGTEMQDRFSDWGYVWDWLCIG
jgi:hypothetical protein